MPNPIQILMLDNEQSFARFVEKEFLADDSRICFAATVEEAFAIVRKKRFDVMIQNIRLPESNGPALMEKFREILPEAEVILITGQEDRGGISGKRQRAEDYITGSFEPGFREGMRKKRSLPKKKGLPHERTESTEDGFIGKSEALARVRYLISRVAPTHVPVLMTGESGTGKSAVSRMIHSKSLRSAQPLITKNCGTLQKELILSELFGYAKGAFTGAAENREGLLALAHKGTLFLDEIGELPLDVQASLLRVLENQSYRRVGDRDERRTDIRFIFATNRNLAEEVRAGRFSEALFHRINVFNIKLPPLKERKEDIPLLIEYFMEKPGMGREYRISPKAQECLLSYDWPGNIRELQNVIERGIILGENGLITEQALPFELADSVRENPRGNPFLSLEEMEKIHIMQVLGFVDGNRVRAAEILGIGRKTLYRKIKQYEMEQDF
ncbi:MAG: sigma-54 dependent transcriptional regulator [Desulfococcaceae bacterium]|jgi:two-component system NtrC family response regulator|nr:sigma-54 dependent transcriptional regulator [Desulfococcaceae bacterium]